MPYYGILGLEFVKGIVISEMSALEFLKNESLTHTVNFGIGFSFSKGPWSRFHEGPGPGPGLLYKICPLITALSETKLEKNISHLKHIFF